MNKYLGGYSYVDQERERDSPIDRQTVRQTEREKTTERKKKKERERDEGEIN